MSDAEPGQSAPAPPADRRRRHPLRWWLPVALGVVLAAYFANNQLTRDTADAPPVAPLPPPVVTAPDPYEPAEIVPPPVTTFERELPDGTVIRVPSDGVEARLIAFIADPARPPDEKLWFEFDRVGFRGDTATLTQASSEQLDNVAAILKAWPFVKLKVGVSTRTQAGDAAESLARDRADALVKDLIKRKTTGERLVPVFGPDVAQTFNGKRAPNPAAVQVTAK